MFFLIGDRNRLIEQFPKNGRWAEIGVYRGDFSQRILETCLPSEFYLIDNWKFAIDEHNPFANEAENFAGFSSKIHWQHFGDDPNASQEQNYQHVSRFEGKHRRQSHHVRSASKRASGCPTRISTSCTSI